MQRSRLHGCAMTMTSHQHPKDRNPGLAHPSHASTHRWRGRTRKDPARCSPLTGRRAYRAHACAIGARAPIAFSAYSSVRFDRVGQLPCRRYRRPCVAHGRCAAAGHGEPQDTNNRYKSCSCAASCAQWARERDVGRPRAAPDLALQRALTRQHHGGRLLLQSPRPEPRTPAEPCRPKSAAERVLPAAGGQARCPADACELHGCALRGVVSSSYYAMVITRRSSVCDSALDESDLAHCKRR